MERPVLSAVQRSWLREIGLDARMLAHFSSEPFAAPEPQRLGELLKQTSVAQVPGVQARPDSPRTPGVVPEPASGTEAEPASTRPTEVSDPAQADSLGVLEAYTEACQACGLNEVRGRIVFGEGAATGAQWMFVGEAPGGWDDSIGRPFQGRPGELLHAMLRAAGIAADAPAYFTNVLKCRPMGNRSPRADEVAACMPILRRQIRLVKPASLVALGRVAASALLGGDVDLETLRGRVHAYVDEDGRSIPLVVTHHPASLLLHGQLKAEAWRDLNLLMSLSR